MPAGPRSRPVLAALGTLTIALGLASRSDAASLPPFVAAYAGDTLWATLVFWIVAAARPRLHTVAVTAVALAIAFVVEFSQLVHSAWIDALRSHPVPALVLGQGFLWSDLVCYGCGVALGAAIDRALVPRADA